MNPLRYILAAIRAFLLILTLVLFLFPYVILSSFLFTPTQERAFKLRRWFINICNIILGIHHTVEGQPSQETALYVSNHRSFSDPLILLKYLDAYVIAKAEVAKMPLIHHGASLTGIIYVQRNDKNSRSAVRKALVDTLRKGLNVLVYPEGTTNPFRELLEYRPGTFLEAANHNIPVVPVVLEYRSRKDIWFNRSLVAQFFRQFGYWRCETKLSFGPPIVSTDGIALRDKIQKWSQDKIEEMHRGWNSVFEHEQDAR